MSPEQYVMLDLVSGIAGGYGPAQLDWIRRMPDGNPDNKTNKGPGGQFRIPKGLALIITDVDWQYASAGAAGEMQILRLLLVQLGRSEGERVFESAIILGPNCSGGTSVAMTTGIVAYSDVQIGVEVFPGPLGPPGGLQHALLRGHLTKI